MAVVFDEVTTEVRGADERAPDPDRAEPRRTRDEALRRLRDDLKLLRRREARLRAH